MGRKPIVMRHISKIDLDKLYKKETNLRIKERLLAIVHLYEGKNVYEVANILKRSERTVNVPAPPGGYFPPATKSNPLCSYISLSQPQHCNKILAK